MYHETDLTVVNDTIEVEVEVSKQHSQLKQGLDKAIMTHQIPESCSL